MNLYNISDKIVFKVLKDINNVYLQITKIDGKLIRFGNPEHSEVMWQLSEAVDGMAAACVAFDSPVVGGNVSLYNETNGHDIAPTPVVGVVGMHPNLKNRPPGMALSSGMALVLLGNDADLDTAMGGSRWAWEIGGCKDGRLPEFDLSRGGGRGFRWRDLLEQGNLR